MERPEPHAAQCQLDGSRDLRLYAALGDGADSRSTHPLGHPDANRCNRLHHSNPNRLVNGEPGHAGHQLGNPRSHSLWNGAERNPVGRNRQRGGYICLYACVRHGAHNSWDANAFSDIYAHQYHRLQHRYEQRRLDGNSDHTDVVPVGRLLRQRSSGYHQRLYSCRNHLLHHQRVDSDFLFSHILRPDQCRQDGDTECCRDRIGSLCERTSVGGYNILLPTATPTFSPAASTYESEQTVTISDTTPGATIYYSISGSTPIAYTGPITVSVSETLTAIALATGDSESARASAAYIITGCSE